MPLGGLGDETDVEQLVDDDRKRHVAEVAYFVATRPPNLVLNEIIMTALSQANSSYINKK